MSSIGISDGIRMMQRFTPWWRMVAALTAGVTLSAPGGAAGRTWLFNVPRQNAAAGIATFSRQATTVQLLVAQDAVRGRRTNRLNGAYPVEIALTILLRGSGLRWLRTGPTTYSLVATDKDSVR